MCAHALPGKEGAMEPEYIGYCNILRTWKPTPRSKDRLSVTDVFAIRVNGQCYAVAPNKGIAICCDDLKDGQAKIAAMLDAPEGA